MKDLFEFDADLVVLAIGENVPGLGSEDDKARFKEGVMKILRGVLARRRWSRSTVGTNGPRAVTCCRTCGGGTDICAL